MKIFKTITIIATMFILFQLVGCASITGGTQQSISIETKKDSTQVSGANCELTNAKGKWFVTTPGSVQLQRSNDALLISCNKEGFDTGRASVESIVRAGMAGNVVFGGVIGMAIDHASGAAYDYPNLIQVMMGESNTISYNYEKGASPGSTISKPAQTSTSASGPGKVSPVTPNASEPAPAIATPQNPIPTRITLSEDDNAKGQSASISSDVQKLEDAKNKCLSYGLVAQTDAYGKCMSRLIN